MMEADAFQETPGSPFSLTCKVSTFMLFNTMEFSQQFVNGSAVIGDGFNVLKQWEGTYRAFQKFSVVLTPDVVRITCSAPMRNAARRVTASIGSKDIENLLTLSNYEDGLTQMTAPAKLLIFTAVFMTSISLLCILYATRKYRQSKVLDLVVQWKWCITVWHYFT